MGRGIDRRKGSTGRHGTELVASRVMRARSMSTNGKLRRNVPRTVRQGSTPSDPSFVTGIDHLRRPMFFFFSNRLGCLGSLIASIVGSLLLIWILIAVNR